MPIITATGRVAHLCALAKVGTDAAGTTSAGCSPGLIPALICCPVGDLIRVCFADPCGPTSQGQAARWGTAGTVFAGLGAGMVASLIRFQRVERAKASGEAALPASQSGEAGLSWSLSSRRSFRSYYYGVVGAVHMNQRSDLTMNIRTVARVHRSPPLQKPQRWATPQKRLRAKTRKHDSSMRTSRPVRDARAPNQHLRSSLRRPRKLGDRRNVRQSFDE
jgi:hypothetical protein